MSLRERERESKSKKGKQTGKERENKSVGHFISKLPGPKLKIPRNIEKSSIVSR
jgi:hypothetical protein